MKSEHLIKLDERINIRLFKEERNKVKSIVAHKNKYLSESHFYRVAVIKLIREERGSFE